MKTKEAIYEKALKDILEELPERPKLPIIHRIKEITENALKLASASDTHKPTPRQ